MSDANTGGEPNHLSCPPRVAFLGTPATAVPVLKALAEAIPIEAVFCNADKPTGRGRKVEAPPVKTAGLELGLPVYQPLTWRSPETRAQWNTLAIDMAVVVAYGHILPTWMLDSCTLGPWNLHFSILPRWRGAAPVNHAILAGDAETGVTLMRITPELDAGPILAASTRPIGPQDSAASLLSILAEDAAQLLRAHLPALLVGDVQPQPQHAASVTYASKLDKAMACLDLSHTATELHRQVRALQPWPGSELSLEATLIKVCAVGTLRPSQDPLGTLRWDRTGAWLTAGDGQALELTLLQRPGKPVQPALQALQPWGAAGCKLLPQTQTRS